MDHGGKCVLCDLLTTVRVHEIISVIWGNESNKKHSENFNVIFAFAMTELPVRNDVMIAPP